MVQSTVQAEVTADTERLLYSLQTLCVSEGHNTVKLLVKTLL